MSLFVVQYAYSAEAEPARDRVRPQHASYLAELEREGILVLSGPYVDKSGALLMLRECSEQECRRRLDSDPFWQAGLVADRQIAPFLVGFGLPQETDRVVRPAVVASATTKAAR